MAHNSPSVSRNPRRAVRPATMAVERANPARLAETPTERLDRVAQSRAAAAFRHLSPITLGLAWADWAWHLAAAPGRQLELATLGAKLALDTVHTRSADDEGVGLQDDDPRFRAEEWARWPFSQWRAGFRNAEAFWREATCVPGVSE